MIPTSSSGTTNGCDNISSNCVIWQGPDIACIDLCNGDSISEVAAKIGNKVCQIITEGVAANPSLSGLDLTCLNIPGQTPTEIVPVLQAMVNQICLNSQSEPDPEPGSDLPMMTLPACLQYQDASGNPVTELRLDAFATLIANQVCTNLTSIQTINTTLTSLDSRIVILENCILDAQGNCNITAAEAQIIPTCILPQQLTDVSVVVLAIEAAFCSLRDATGDPAAINIAIGQSSITGSSNSLTSSSVSYGSIPGWNNAPINLAQSVQNAWVVIDDLYQALADVQTNCCATNGCDSVTFNYTASSVLNAQGLISQVQLVFTSSTIPATFNDVTGFSLVDITDVNGSSVSQQFSVASEQSNSNGILVPVSALDTSSDLTVTVRFRVTDGIDTCSDTLVKTVAGVVPCLTPTASAITETSVDVLISNNLGSTITIKIDILDAQGQVAATTTVNNPPVNIQEQLTGLVAGSAYEIVLTITSGGVAQVCPPVLFNTTSASKVNCDAGLDVVFALDYSPEMLTPIQDLQNNFASLVSTIAGSVQAGNKYRIGITTVDESIGLNMLPPYSLCAQYSALTNNQRLNNSTSGGNTIHLTAWELMSDDNGATATAALNNLANGASGQVGGCVQMGGGATANADPTDQLIAQNLMGNFAGTWRSSVQKVLIAVTTAEPSGGDDFFDQTDVAYLSQLAQIALQQGILCFVVGQGVDKTYNPGGGLPIQYPWRDFATATNGDWNSNDSAATIAAMINTACGTAPNP